MVAGCWRAQTQNKNREQYNEENERSECCSERKSVRKKTPPPDFCTTFRYRSSIHPCQSPVHDLYSFLRLVWDNLSLLKSRHQKWQAIFKDGQPLFACSIYLLLSKAEFSFLFLWTGSAVDAGAAGIVHREYSLWRAKPISQRLNSSSSSSEDIGNKL